ncbi:hypothetical protein ACIGXM_13440 [Kitasatospora sp. NPDC052896]|uniref:hypothetical protein n=1 Tax=Kitasatospora sp. NPDC052896 TaxID=3364061 RepID=UPI0037CAAB22
MGFSSGGRPAQPEEFFDDQESRCRQVIGEADFPIFGVDRSGHGVRGIAPARDEEYSRPLEGAGHGPVDSDALSAFETHNGELSWVELRSGDWSSLDGPYVTVRTYRPGAERSHPLPELEDVVEDERDRVYHQLGVDEEEVPARVRALREWITVEGEPTAVQLHEERRADAYPGEDPRAVWAGRLRVAGSTVTICGRGIAPGRVELARVLDTDRFVRGRTALLQTLAARRARAALAAERQPVNVTGLDAHRAIIEYTVAHALALQTQQSGCRPSRLPRRLRGADQAERWEAAVRQQMRLASESREEADAAVAAMVDHLTRLAEQTDWAQDTADGRAALEEVVRYTAFASHVPSLPAQQAWELLTAGPRSAADAEERRWTAEQAWLAAWEQWRRERARG